MRINPKIRPEIKPHPRNTDDGAFLGECKSSPTPLGTLARDLLAIELGLPVNEALRTAREFILAYGERLESEGLI